MRVRSRQVVNGNGGRGRGSGLKSVFGGEGDRGLGKLGWGFDGSCSTLDKGIYPRV